MRKGLGQELVEATEVGRVKVKKIAGEREGLGLGNEIGKG